MSNLKKRNSVVDGLVNAPDKAQIISFFIYHGVAIVTILVAMVTVHGR